MQCDKEADWDAQFLPVWNKVKDLVLVPEPKTIDGITDTLVQHDILSVKDNYEAHQSAKELVFSILGWQTMLYKPQTTSCTTGEFNILDETDKHQGEARLRLSQSSVSGKYDLPSFLLGFGMMLPPPQYCAFDDTDDRQLFNVTKQIVAKELNAHILTKICGVKIQWVDSVSCHLELDRQSGSLPWATENDVTELLREVLLSYRLLFGQSGRSRSLFRKLQPFARIPHEGHDPFLPLICGRKDFNCPITLVEREEYDVAGDFPHLRSRIVRLISYASSKKPRSIRQLWQDKRDSTTWLAFWSVLIFGEVLIVFGSRLN
ncbi:uncharacterized protein J7T54_006688 [Emericellopsis cladophorae]|uniref:Uncharacterized protein n=1 Tax=Emericellopsis cladophorae TaxID=2686198 RepID=A0A9Q0BGM1_9HYPO|nr:uncharacterized protein J7T54_006688 [Emericellopsis cladophorae]KAI6784642.1 hypothetical protein J7T54_006688 [Emericellopsis cladophorae]